MPCIVGAVKILSVQQGAVVQFGDALQVSPQSSAKTFAGAGSFLTGDLSRTNNGISATNTNDSDAIDSSSAENQPSGGVVA